MFAQYGNVLAFKFFEYVESLFFKYKSFFDFFNIFESSV